MTSNRRGFTLIELMVVIAMIAIFMTAVGASVGQTRERARIEKARSDVKVIAQAILAWENYAVGGDHKLEAKTDEEANSSSLGFLLGQGEAAKSGQIPALLMAQLQAGGRMCDPWGAPYRLRIKEGTIVRPNNLDLDTCYYIPNLYRLSPGERQ